MSQFETDIELGQKYRDDYTGITGAATAVIFELGKEPEVYLERVVESIVTEDWFPVTRVRRAT